MKKKWKIFFGIIYYFLTFSLSPNNINLIHFMSIFAERYLLQAIIFALYIIHFYISINNKFANFFNQKKSLYFIQTPYRTFPKNSFNLSDFG